MLTTASLLDQNNSSKARNENTESPYQHHVKEEHPPKATPTANLLCEPTAETRHLPILCLTSARIAGLPSCRIPGFCSCFCRLQLGNQIFQTAVAHGSTLPVWSPVTSFVIKNRNEPLVIDIFLWEPPNNTQLLTSITFSLSNMSEQNHDEIELLSRQDMGDSRHLDVTIAAFVTTLGQTMTPTTLSAPSQQASYTHALETAALNILVACLRRAMIAKYMQEPNAPPQDLKCSPEEDSTDENISNVAPSLQATPGEGERTHTAAEEAARSQHASLSQAHSGMPGQEERSDR
jgi:hypothetical protein